MSLTPSDVQYTASHAWVRLEEDGTLAVGITDHAQDALGDVVFVELPAVGQTFAEGEQAGVVESVKSASEIYAPVAGTVVAINEALSDNPETLNEAPYSAWIYRLQPATDANTAALLDAAGYQASCA